MSALRDETKSCNSSSTSGWDSPELCLDKTKEKERKKCAQGSLTILSNSDLSEKLCSRETVTENACFFVTRARERKREGRRGGTRAIQPMKRFSSLVKPSASFKLNEGQYAPRFFFYLPTTTFSSFGAQSRNLVAVYSRLLFREGRPVRQKNRGAVSISPLCACEAASEYRKLARPLRGVS